MIAKNWTNLLTLVYANSQATIVLSANLKKDQSKDIFCEAKKSEIGEKSSYVCLQQHWFCFIFVFIFAFDIPIVLYFK